MNHEKRDNRQFTFGLYILLGGIISLLAAFLINFPQFTPDIVLLGIGFMWVFGGLLLMLT